MVADGVRSSGTVEGRADELSTQCERCVRLLDELFRVHLEIDAPARKTEEDEPDWILRLRKVGLHVLAMKGWEIGADVEQVMASELRAAYVQMGAVWEHLPEEYRLDTMNVDWWANEARNGVLATYDHPTPQSLLLPAGAGGFGTGEDGRSYAQLAVWLGRLGLGYGLALAFLAQVLGVEGEVVPRVADAVRGLELAVART